MSQEKMMVLVLTALFIKHYFADFVLQTPYMFGKGKPGWDWILPLVTHAGVHAGFTAMIFYFYKPQYAWLAAIDLILHMIIDRLKATYKLPAGVWPQELRQVYLDRHYAAFGLDQLFHGLTYMLLIYLSI